MSTAAAVAEALTLFSTFEENRGAVAVHTHCLYPDNAVVTVWVRGGPEYGFVVCDEGRAIDELTAYNKEIPNPDRFLFRFCRREGLLAKDGKIHSPRVPIDSLASAVSFVATASAHAVTRGLETLQIRRPRNLRKELSELLGRTLPVQHVHREVRLPGKTMRFYRFDAVIDLGERRRLLVDPVTPDPGSINARAVAHFDVGRLEDGNILQRIVYDDRHDWPAADLNLLQMAATVVPFSQSEKMLRSLHRDVL